MIKYTAALDAPRKSFSLGRKPRVKARVLSSTMSTQDVNAQTVEGVLCSDQRTSHGEFGSRLKSAALF